MEWIIISGVIIVTGYIIYSAIKKSNDINEKQLELKKRELELNPDYIKNREYKEWEEEHQSRVKKYEEARYRHDNIKSSGNENAIKEAESSFRYEQENLKAWLDMKPKRHNEKA